MPDRKQKTDMDTGTVRHIVLNLGKLGMPVKRIASVVETDWHTVSRWLDDAGIDPDDHKTRVRERQAEGIAKAKARGVRFGRPMAKTPENFPEIADAMEQGKLSSKDAIRISGMSEATFYRRLRKYRAERIKNAGDLS